MWSYSGDPGSSDRDQVRFSYLAGIIDGEGSVDARFKHKMRTVDFTLSVANTDVRLIEWIVENFGGRAIPIRQANPKHKIVWRVIWNVQDATQVLEDVMPYLIVKRERAELYLSLRALMGRGEHLTDEIRQQRLDLGARMAELNKRGAA